MSDGFDQKLAALIASIAAPAEADAATMPPLEGIEPVLAEFIFSFLLWETTPKQASAGTTKLIGSFIDLNELRISLPDELAAILGSRYARAAERTLRLRMALNQIFLLEHEMSLARLRELSKRDARQYLIDLPGVPQFVAARVSLLALGAHAFPLDDRLFQLLVSRDVASAEQSADECSQWLERQFRAGEAAEAYLKLEHAASTRTKSARKPAKESNGKAANKASPKRSTKADKASP